MNTICRLIATGRLILAACAWWALPLASAQAAIVSVSPATQTVAPGSIFSIDLNISGLGAGTVLGAWDINIHVDPTLVTFSSAVFGANLDVLGLGSIQSVSSPTAGTINLYEVSLDSVANLTSLQVSNFKLATLQFTASSGTGTMPLNLSINSLGDAYGGALAASVVPSNLNIALVPEPDPIGMFVVGLTVMAACLRRRVAVSSCGLS